MTTRKKIIYSTLGVILVCGIILAFLSTSEYKTEEVTHYKNGNIKSKLLIHKKTNHQLSYSYYPDGKLEKRGRFNAFGDGVDTGFYRSGEILFTCDYQGSEPFGIYTSYYKSGEKEVQGLINYNEEEGEWKAFYENGNIKEHWRYFDGKLSEIFACYDQNGDSLNYGDFENGNGHVVSYHNNGESKDLVVYKDGYPHNVKNIFSSTGKELPIGSFKDGSGELNYYQDSVLDYISIFENGISIDYMHPEEKEM